MASPSAVCADQHSNLDEWQKVPDEGQVSFVGRISAPYQALLSSRSPGRFETENPHRVIMEDLLLGRGTHLDLIEKF